MRYPTGLFLPKKLVANMEAYLLPTDGSYATSHLTLALQNT
jgi:hypothetical protein